MAILGGGPLDLCWLTTDSWAARLIRLYHSLHAPMTLRRLNHTLPYLLVICLSLCLGFRPSCASPPPREAPRLILLLVADQFPARYRERYKELFTAGLHTLFTDGAIFSRARHEHACTETCPGHATLATGTPPSMHGIVANEWFDKAVGQQVYCASDPSYGTSPARLLTSTIGDWLRAAHPSSRVYAVSGKDRAAVMLGGHHPTGAFWYDPGRAQFTTSAYYPPDRSMLDEFHQKAFITRYNRDWSPITHSPELLSRLGVITHAEFAPLLKLIPSAGERLYNTPFLDEATADLAEQILIRKQLGRGESQDLLLVSFSALDIVGHSYGSAALETVDTLVRLDALVGRLIKRAQAAAEGRVLIIFSSDHGIQATPDSPEGQSLGTTRINPADLQCAEQAIRGVSGTSGSVLIDQHQQETAAFHRLSADNRKKAVKTLDAATKMCSWVETVRFAKTFAGDGERSDTDMQLLYRRAYYPGRGPDLFIQPKEHVVLRPYAGASHGTPYSYDTDVPVVFMGNGIVPSQIDSPFPTTHVAPLVAQLAAIPIQREQLPSISQPQLKRDYNALFGH